MKKLKIALLLIVVGFIGLVVYQNQDFFLAKNNLNLHIMFLLENYQTPDISNGLFLLGCFLIGFFISYVLTLLTQFKSGRTIKTLNADIVKSGTTITSLNKQVEDLKKELAYLQSQKSPETETAQVEEAVPVENAEDQIEIADAAAPALNEEAPAEAEAPKTD